MKEHGGKFTIAMQDSTGYGKKIEEKVNEPKAVYVVVDPEGNETIPENFQGYCRKNNLNKSALYGVAKGERKHHKNYTCYRKEV